MAKLIYTAISSLDGYVADAEGNFDWSAPADEVHRFVNELERPIGTYLYGRQMYEVMRYWETAPTGNDKPSAEQEYARIWQAADKIIYSKSLEQVSSARTRIEREFDHQAIQQLKAAATRDVSVSGPTLAAQAMKLGLVDECRLFSPPSSWEAAIPPCRTTSAWGWNCWTSADSATAWSISITASRRDSITQRALPDDRGYAVSGRRRRPT
jgi:dihydrofolate reductase